MPDGDDGRRRYARRMHAAVMRDAYPGGATVRGVQALRRHPPGGLLGALGLLVTLAAPACGNLPQDTSPDPCAELTLLCPYCTRATDEQHCTDAVNSADEGQCAAILDQPSIQSGCAPRDGGTDAQVHDAGPLPACGASGAPDAGCACAAGCAPTCPAGGCAFTCAGGTCSPTCAGGRCTVTCEPGATCEGSCAGGDCVFDCKNGSTCANACAGGGCSFQCEVGAVCNDTCGGATTCAGF